MKAARAIVAAAPGLAKTLGSDRRKAARFCAKFGITEWALSPAAPDSEGGKIQTSWTRWERA